MERFLRVSTAADHRSRRHPNPGQQWKKIKIPPRQGKPSAGRLPLQRRKIDGRERGRRPTIDKNPTWIKPTGGRPPPIPNLFSSSTTNRRRNQAILPANESNEHNLAFSPPRSAPSTPPDKPGKSGRSPEPQDADGREMEGRKWGGRINSYQLAGAQILSPALWF